MSVPTVKVWLTAAALIASSIALAAPSATAKPLARSTDQGRVIAWGTSFANVNVVPAAARSGVSAIAASSHALALKEGRVIAWGYNEDGQASVPTDAEAGVTAIAAGTDHSLAIRGGRVLAWGDDDYDQVTVPQEAQSGVTAIAGGGFHSLAVKDGGVLAWGDNESGQTTVPDEAKQGVTAIAAGYAHSLALKDGRVIAWGDNGSGQTTVPQAAQDGVTAIAAGGAHSLALKDGQVIAWGSNRFDQSTVPPIAQAGVTAIAAGDQHSLALKDGGVIAWGADFAGQTTVPEDAERGIESIAAGGGLSLALTSRPQPVVPETPQNFAASVGSWSGGTLPVTFTWSPPTPGTPAVDVYRLRTPSSETTAITQQVPGDRTSWVVQLPRAVTSDFYTATLIARNSEGPSPAATLEFFVPPLPPPVPPVSNLAVAEDRQQSSLTVSWSKPKEPSGLTLQRYDVERRVPAIFRKGADWQVVGSPSAPLHLDPCVPPGMKFDYRVRAIYVDPGTQRVYDSDWRETSGTLFSFPGPAPATTPAEVTFEGIRPEDGPLQNRRAHMKVAFNGELSSFSSCFAMEHDVQARLTPSPFPDVKTNFTTAGVIGGRTKDDGPRLLQRTFALGPAAFERTIAVGVRSRWALDWWWKLRYGEQFNDLVTSSIGAFSRDRPTFIESPWLIHTSNAGVKVRNLKLTWRDNLGLRATWDAPADNTPSVVNVRGYEVCFYTTQRYVYLDDYPTVSHIKCWITARDQRVLTPSRDDWCPPFTYVSPDFCARAAANVFVQVRPWVGSAQAQSIYPGSVWTDWNRNTFEFARPQ